VIDLKFADLILSLEESVLSEIKVRIFVDKDLQQHDIKVSVSILNLDVINSLVIFSFDIII
jgi:hypothetical protein